MAIISHTSENQLIPNQVVGSANNQDYFNAGRQNLIQQEQEQLAHRSLLGNILGGLGFDALGRLGRGALSALNGNTASMNFGEQETYKENPLQYMLQRVADVGSLGAYALPGAGSALGAIGQGALIGGLSGFGGAQPGSDALDQGINGALTGGVVGGALRGAGNIVGGISERLGGKAGKIGEELQQTIKPKPITEASSAMSPESIQRAYSTIESVGGKTTKEVAQNLSNEYNSLNNQLSQISKAHPVQGATPFSSIKAGLSNVVSESSATGKYVGQKLLDIMKQAEGEGAGGATVVPLEKMFKVLKANPGQSTMPLKEFLTNVQKSALSDVPEYQNLLSRMSDIHHTFDVMNFGNAPGFRTFERLHIPGTPISIGMPSAFGEITQKAKYNLGGVLKGLSEGGSPQLIGKVSNALKSGPLQHIAEQGVVGSMQQPIPMNSMPINNQQVPSTQDEFGDPTSAQQYDSAKGQIAMQLLQNNPKMSPTEANAYATTYLASRGVTAPATGASAVRAENIRNSAAQLQNLSDMINKDGSAMGPIQGRITGVKQMLGDSSASRLTATLGVVKQMVAKSLEGGKLSNADIVRYEDMVPTVNTSPEQAKERIAALMSILNQEYRASQ